jgi:hypothetical protein
MQQEEGCDVFGPLTFSGVFAKLQEVSTSSVISVPLSIRMKKLVSHWTDFS